MRDQKVFVLMIRRTVQRFVPLYHGADAARERKEKKMEAYLDNSATTRCTEAVRDVVVRTMMEDYGNPSSKHRKGLDAEHFLREARETIARTLKVNEKEIFSLRAGQSQTTGR